MKNETVGAKKLEGKAGLSAATLPWWAKVLIAQHTESSFSVSTSHPMHHCSYCRRVLISASATYPYIVHLCPDCSKESRVVKAALGPEVAFVGNQRRPDGSDKIQRSQGGN